MQGMVPQFLYVFLLHIIAGSLLVALLERQIVYELYRIRLRAGALIAGNYLSSLIGLIACHAITRKLNIPLSLFSRYAVGHTITFFLYYFFVTLLLEYPFYLMATPKGQRNNAAAFERCIYGNLFSTIVLCLFYICFELYVRR